MRIRYIALCLVALAVLFSSVCAQEIKTEEPKTIQQDAETHSTKLDMATCAANAGAVYPDTGPPVRLPNGKIEKGFPKIPKRLHSAEPLYTEWAKMKNIHGYVSICMIIDERGIPVDVKILHSLGYGLDESAIEAGKQFKFAPPVKDGKPVKLAFPVIFVF